MSGTTMSDAGISIAASTMKNHVSPAPVAMLTMRHTSIGRANTAPMIQPAMAERRLKKLACLEMTSVRSFAIALSIVVSHFFMSASSPAQA